MANLVARSNQGFDLGRWQMRKLMYGSSLAVAMLMIITGIGGIFEKNDGVGVLVGLGLIVLAFTAMSYSSSKCDACDKKDCVCGKPKQQPEKDKKF